MAVRSTTAFLIAFASGALQAQTPSAAGSRSPVPLPTRPNAVTSSPKSPSQIYLLRTSGQPDRQLHLVRSSVSSRGEAIADVVDVHTKQRFTIPQRLLVTAEATPQSSKPLLAPKSAATSSTTAGRTGQPALKASGSASDLSVLPPIGSIIPITHAQPDTPVKWVPARTPVPENAPAKPSSGDESTNTEKR